MEIAAAAERLERARRAIAEGETYIRRQRDLIARLEKAGKDTAEARALLKTILKRQVERQNNLALIVRQLPPKS